MLLNVSTDGIRIFDLATKTMVVDQPIQKISFCSPDQQNDRIFSYIAREGTTRRWICHVFVAFKGCTGERLSHAMGCAFAACLRNKEHEENSMSQSASPVGNRILEQQPVLLYMKTLKHTTREQVYSCARTVTNVRINQ